MSTQTKHQISKPQDVSRTLFTVETSAGRSGEDEMLCFPEFEPKEDFSLECYVRSWKLVPERAGALSRAAQCRSIALFSFRPGRSKGATFLIFAFCVPGMFSNSVGI